MKVDGSATDGLTISYSKETLGFYKGTSPCCKCVDCCKNIAQNLSRNSLGGINLSDYESRRFINDKFVINKVNRVVGALFSQSRKQKPKPSIVGGE